MTKDVPSTAGRAQHSLGTRVTPALSELQANLIGSAPLSWVASVEGLIEGILRWIMFISLLGLSLVMVAQVVMRYLLHLPFLGIEELGPLLALWCYFSGMIYSSRHRTHIEGGILTLIVRNPFLIQMLRLFGTLIVLVTLAVFTYYAWSVVTFNVTIGRRSVYLGVPKYMWDLAFLTGMVGMMLYLVLQAVLEVWQILFRSGKA